MPVLRSRARHVLQGRLNAGRRRFHALHETHQTSARPRLLTSRQAAASWQTFPFRDIQRNKQTVVEFYEL
ncbi:MAG: hypothetical protein ACJ8AP_13560, partial [Gemmatimonadales bacterium]